VLPNEVLGTMVFVMTEIMMFAGFFSAFEIARASVAMWPPLGQPRLPIEETAFNTGALLLSGVLLFVASRRFRRDPAKARVPMLISVLLGAFFVIFQGVEWFSLVTEGLGLTTSNHASFFYLIVGTHALHAVAGLGMLTYLYVQLVRDQLTGDVLWAGQVFWFFVVGLWPFLYWQVYL